MTGERERREAVLGKIRMALGTYASPNRRSVVAGRVAAPLPSLIPERAKRQPAERKALLRTFLEGQAASLVEVGSANEIAVAIASFLRSANLPLRLRTGEDAYLDGLGWEREPALERRRGSAVDTDEVGLSRATAAVAETGTLVLASGPDNPVTLGFLPETHIVIVEERNLVGGYEDAWDNVRALFGRRSMPRTVNFISGPSRSADIGGELVMGAHGPRRLCVILVSEKPAA
jgi:L-lactate dehydrogenase complex protein LldG